MARIPDEVIERLKIEVSVQRLAEARGVVLKKHGADLIGRCPFHEDHTSAVDVDAYLRGMRNKYDFFWSTGEPYFEDLAS